MIRTTAYAAMMAGLLAGTAYAQTAPQTQPGAAQTAPAMQPKQDSMKLGNASANRSEHLAGAHDTAGKWRTSKLMGVEIYGPTNEEVGEVNEVIVDRDGRITHVAISVGGFLGIGAKDVAVPFEQVTWSDQPMKSGSAARTDATRNNTANNAARPAGSPAGTAGGTQAPGAVAPGTANNNAVAPGAPGRTTAPADGMSTASMPARTGDREMNARMYPDHGRITLTREQLEAAPAIKYPE